MVRMAMVIGVLLLICSMASAQSYNISANSANGVLLNGLTAGQVYEFTVSGTYTFGDNDGLADAEWWTRNGSAWKEVHDLAPSGSEDLLDVVINDTSVNWLGTTDGIHFAEHTLSTNNVYKYYYTSTGDPVKLHIADWIPYGNGADFYSDNSGFLTLDVKAVPEPMSIALGILGLSSVGGFRRLRRK